MIEYNIKGKRGKIIKTCVTRTCDCCGRREQCFKDIAIKSRKKRHEDTDYCKTCSYKFRIVEQKIGPDSPFWKGGRRLNTNGYYRLYVYDNGQKRGIYEHKYIYEQHIGRILNKTEQVHHIDGDKINNNIDNLYLCQDKSGHNKIHHGIEILGYSLLGNVIWFDSDRAQYTLVKMADQKCLDHSVQNYILSRSGNYSGRTYVNIYMGNRKHMPFHRYLMEKELGRKLLADEHIHHIDGDSINNKLNNLVLLTRSSHKICHNKLQECVLSLYKMGKVVFRDGEYAIV